MSRRIGIIAAGGESSRTGLGAYTTKAALPLRGKTLLAHQLSFMRRSGVETVFVVARAKHVRLLGELLSREEREFTAFVCSDTSAGWADTIAQALRFVQPDDEVVLISCDNDHGESVAPSLDGQGMIFTYTRWSREDRWPTDGPVFARDTGGGGASISTRRRWIERPGRDFSGDFFSGFVVVRGGLFLTELSRMEPVDGKREFTSLLARLAEAAQLYSMSYPGFRAIQYPGTYEDVADLRALALLDAGLSSWDDRKVSLGGGVLLHDSAGNVLLTLRQDGLGWTIPGGMVDEGETFAQTAAREIWEEIGVRVPESALRLLGVYPCIGKGNPACSVIFHARCDVEENQTRTNPREVLEVGKFNQRGVAGLTIPFNLRAAVDDWFAGRELDVR